MAYAEYRSIGRIRGDQGDNGLISIKRDVQCEEDDYHEMCWMDTFRPGAFYNVDMDAIGALSTKEIMALISDKEDQDA
jgi:hypothetical protein